MRRKNCQGTHLTGGLRRGWESRGGECWQVLQLPQPGRKTSGTCSLPSAQLSCSSLFLSSHCFLLFAASPIAFLFSPRKAWYLAQARPSQQKGGPGQNWPKNWKWRCSSSSKALAAHGLCFPSPGAGAPWPLQGALPCPHESPACLNPALLGVAAGPADLTCCWPTWPPEWD
eukprot:bmy_03501T0